VNHEGLDLDVAADVAGSLEVDQEPPIAAGPWSRSLAADASAAILILISIYIMLFLVLSLWVLVEGCATRLWATGIVEPSIIGAVAMLGGWTGNVLALVNFLFGLGGGFFASSPSGTSAEKPLKWVISALCLVLMMLSLVDIVLVALGSLNIEFQVSIMKNHFATSKDAINALGLIHLSIVSGFLSGFAIRGVPAIGRGG
jgi:hypothetical protein